MSEPPATHTQDLQAEALARDIASDMPSPYCPGRSIASCPSQPARDLEDDILALAKEGRDRKEIELALVARFGEEKMGKGQQTEVLVAILIAAAVALVFIVYAARRWLRRPSDASAAGFTGESKQNAGAGDRGQAQPDELDRLEDELDELDEL